jgi:hypothetical protein
MVKFKPADVILWIVTLVGALIAGLGPAYTTWAPPGLIVLLFWLCVVIMSVGAIWYLVHWSRTTTKLSVQRSRLIGAIILLAVAFLFILPVAWSTTHAWLAIGTLALPRVEIVAQRAAIRTTETANLSGSVDGKEAQGYNCDWTVAGERRKPECRISYRPAPGTRGEVPITVRVITADGWEIGSASFKIHVSYQGQVEVSPQRVSAFIGDDLQWTAKLDQHPVSGDQKCQWVLDDRVVIPSDPTCTAAYQAGDRDVGSHRIKVAVTDINGETIAGGETQFTVRSADPVYFEYAIDASARMSRPGHAILQSVIRNLVDELDRIVSGSVGLQLAGDDQGSKTKAACDNARELWPLQPINPVRGSVRSALQSVHPGNTDSVPLNNAVQAAFFALGRGGGVDANRILAIFTAGPDTCRDKRIAELLKELEAANPTIHIQPQIYDYRLLTLTVAIAFTEEQKRRWQAQDAERFSIDDGATVVLLARSTDDLQTIQAALSRFTAARHRDRVKACNSLFTFGKQRGAFASEADQRALSRYCQRIR